MSMKEKCDMLMSERVFASGGPMNLEETLYRIHHEKLYYCDNEELMKEQGKYLDMVFEYNHLPPSKGEEKKALLKKMFGKIGESSYIETPFYANWGGKNVYMGDHVYANFNLVLVDDAVIEIGDHVMIGPNVVLCTGTHPVSPRLRAKESQYNKRVKVGSGVWIGANTMVMPGVTIGENSIIGAGSVVTKDIPANVIAFGNPCKVYREITEEDEKYYDKDKLIDIE